MKKKRAFTLIELMVVIMIVAVLAAIAVPILRQRVDNAIWLEGKEMMETIATAIDSHAKLAPARDPPTSLWVGEPNNLGFETGHKLTGNNFNDDDFSFEVHSMNPLLFIVTAIKPGLNPPVYTLNQDKIFKAHEK